MIIKMCKFCSLEKELSLFVKEKRSKDGTTNKCLECRQSTRPKENQPYNEKRKKWQVEYLKRTDVKKRRSETWKKHYNENIDKYLLKANENHQKIEEKIYNNCIRRFNHAIKSDRSKYIFRDIFGINKYDYIKYLESKFTNQMNWGNYGTLWEIDHINPISTHDLTSRSDLTRAFGYENTQPLLVSENRKKFNKKEACNA